MTDFDVVTILAWPVDVRERTFIETVTGRKLPVYTGAEIRPCADCGRRCWVGPRSLETAAAQPDAKIQCPWCVVRTNGGASETTIKNLGNPERQDS